MSLKLSRLKKWLTLEDSAKHLSLLLSEEVTTTDLLQLAIHGELTLSVTMPGSLWAYPYTTGALKNMARARKQLENQPRSPAYTAALLAQLEFVGFRIQGEGGASGKLAPDYLDGRTISGTWDLSMLGAERELVTELAGSLQNNSPAFAGDHGLENNRPIILSHPSDAGLLVGLIDNGESLPLEGEPPLTDEPADPELIEGLFLISFDARKVQQFPTGSFFVIRAENLQKLTSQLSESQAKERPTTQDLPHKFQQLYGAIAGGELPDLEAVIEAWYSHWNQRAARGERDTYPKNPNIQEWLEKRGVSKNKAESIPPLIRPTWG